MSSKIHTVYKTKDGQKVPSVTTVIGILNKPYLLKWAWQCGIDGIDYTKERDAAGDAGTLAHAMILNHIHGTSTNTDTYSKETIKLAKNAFGSYLAWEKNNKLSPLLVERPLVVENGAFSYGGTMDFYGHINGVLSVMDFKTGKGLYDEYIIQLGAYGGLLVPNQFAPAEEFRLLRIGREDGDSYEEKIIKDVSVAWGLFHSLLLVYGQLKQLRNE